LEDETKNLLGELEFYLKSHNGLPIEQERHPFGECRHFRVVLDDQKHTVTCRDCKKELDPFWYLQLLTKEWSLRRYHDIETIKAYRELEQQRLNAKARGKICARPKEGIGREVWDAATLWKDTEPNCIYYRGQWYVECWEESIDAATKVKNQYMTTCSYDYIKMQLANKKIT
jgi:hypothetical protein